MTAILFGSISTIADTSELQREAFNRAFASHGLDWQWGQEEYAEMLATSGGRDRIAEHARSTGADVDADAVHQTKSEIFQQLLGEADLTPRDGVVETIAAAREAGHKVALVTTTSRENVKALGRAVADRISFDDLDLVVDRTQVEQPKPDGEAYTFALAALGEPAGSCVAVEDNLGGVEAAARAGLSVVAFPNANTAGHDFERATARRDRLELTDLQSFTQTA